MLERRFSATALAAGDEARISDGIGAIVGYAAVFYDGTPKTEFVMGRVRERIARGAFAKVIKNDDVRALFNHNPDHLLGRKSAGTLSLREDAHGLRYTINPGDTQIGRDVKEHLRRGDLSGSSYGYKVEDDTWEPDGETVIRTIRSIAMLLDVGPVTYPAYTSTSVSLRSLSEGWLDSIRRREMELDLEELAL